MIKKRKVYIMCKYKEWGKYWFKQLAEHWRKELEEEDPELVLKMKIKPGKMIIELPKLFVQFVPESKIGTYTAGDDYYAVVNWQGDDIRELTFQIIA